MIVRSGYLFEHPLHVHSSKHEHNNPRSRPTAGIKCDCVYLSDFQSVPRTISTQHETMNKIYYGAHILFILVSEDTLLMLV